MVKGVSRRVVVVRSPDPRVFDEAIFIVREDAAHGGVTHEELVKEARSVAEDYIRAHGTKKTARRIPAPLFALAGAGVTALVWALAQFVF